MMRSGAQQDKVREWLTSIGLTEICQWDVLVFLQRHRDALVTPELISRLIGYRPALITIALDHLESLGLVERSRLSQGARLYQLLELDGARGRDFRELRALADSRTGRLTMMKELRQRSNCMAIAAKQESITTFQDLKRSIPVKHAR
jgi:DNA-binding MarR family transcriptional regulator